MNKKMDNYEKKECRHFFKEIIDEIVKATKLSINGFLNLYANRDKVVEGMTKVVAEFSKEEIEEQEPGEA